MDKHTDGHPPADTLSAIGRKLLKVDAETTYTKLTADGAGNEAVRPMLDSLSPPDLLDGPVVSEDDAAALLSALWLRFDWLDESHRISQKIETPTGSFWHAIMHRREGDFANSKYWYARIGDHPALPTLAARAGDVINPYPADKSIFRITATGWNAAAYVDLVESIHDRHGDSRHALAVALQRIEWDVLFEHCTRAAGGR